MKRVVVLTGASSGIGHATALALGRRGDSVVLVSRGADALEQVADAVRSLGGDALPIAADVAKWEDVDRVAREAASHFGRIDVWINNAAVAEWALIETMAPDEMRRIVEVNLLGPMYGVRAALPYLRRSEHGVIVNIASALADRAIPLLSVYSASKAAVKTFSDSLRMELRAGGANIDVVTILPSSINTPFYKWGRSKMGVRPHPVSVIYPPNAVAEAIVAAIDRPQREIFIGFMGKLLSLGERISPALLDRLMLTRQYLFREQYTSIPDRGESNLYASPNETEIEGPFSDEMRRGSVYTKAVELRPWVRRGVFGACVVALAALVSRPRRLFGGTAAGRRRVRIPLVPSARRR